MLLTVMMMTDCCGSTVSAKMTGAPLFVLPNIGPAGSFIVRFMTRVDATKKSMGVPPLIA